MLTQNACDPVFMFEITNYTIYLVSELIWNTLYSVTQRFLEHVNNISMSGTNVLII